MHQEVKTYTATFYWPEGDVLLQYGFHFGTHLDLARECVVMSWHWRRHQHGQAQSVALWFDGKIVDCYWGPEIGWTSDVERRHAGVRDGIVSSSS